ncbi:MAG: hypothetical protein ACPIOQ_04065, partial [Promethearchaeia archaeon]
MSKVPKPQNFVNHLVGSDPRVQSFGLSLSLLPPLPFPPLFFLPFSSLSPFPLLPSFPVRIFEKRPKPQNFGLGIQRNIADFRKPFA